MKTKDFYSFYDLKEIIIHSIKNIDNNIIITYDADVEMYLMANGFRSGFDLSFMQQATFLNVNIDIDISEPIYISKYKYKDDHLYIVANGKEISIPDSDVIIKKIKNNRI